MRALLVTNPRATAVSARTRDIIVRALGSELKLDVAETSHRGHAADLAARARADAFDVVVAVGGDGTVNEVVSGLLRDGVGEATPRLGVVPGGNANVFARALGLPTEPVEATSMLIERLRTNADRRVGLGRVDLSDTTRWFTFCAGIGLDAEVVREVEHRRKAGATASPPLYLRAGVRQFARTNRREPALMVRGQTPDGVRDGPPLTHRPAFMAIITNTSPWTYLGSRPLQPTPASRFDAGLDIFAVPRLGTMSTARMLLQLIAGGTPRGRGILTEHDLAEISVGCLRPVAVQVDGDYLGEYDNAVFRSIPEALRVLA